MATLAWRISRNAAATAVTLLLGASAQGKFVVGDFDPVASGGYPGYKGSATFDVSPTCLPAGDTGFAFVTGECGPISFLGATVSLYGPGSISGTPASSFVLGPGALTVTGIRVVNGEVAGIDTSRSGFSTAPDPVNSFSLAGFALQFFSGCTDLNFAGVQQSNPYTACGTLFDFDEFSTDTVTPQGAPPILPFTLLYSSFVNSGGLPGSHSVSLVFRPLQVPEPGALALIGAALGAGWLARRRRKRSFDLA